MRCISSSACNIVICLNLSKFMPVALLFNCFGIPTSFKPRRKSPKSTIYSVLSSGQWDGIVLTYCEFVHSTESYSLIKTCICEAWNKSEFQKQLHAMWNTNLHAIAIRNFASHFVQLFLKPAFNRCLSFQAWVYVFWYYPIFISRLQINNWLLELLIRILHTQTHTKHGKHRLQRRIYRNFKNSKNNWIFETIATNLL